MSEPTYTLQEAMRELALRECVNHGHSWEIVSNFIGEPVRVHCDSCGWSGDVAMGDRPVSGDRPAHSHPG